MKMKPNNLKQNLLCRISPLDVHSFHQEDLKHQQATARGPQKTLISKLFFLILFSHSIYIQTSTHLSKTLS